jgi:hypothetical protein
MNQEYPESKQRWAVCNSLWDRRAAEKIRKSAAVGGEHKIRSKEKEG